MAERFKNGDRALVTPDGVLYRELDRRGIPHDDGCWPRLDDLRGTVLRVTIVVEIGPPVNGISIYRPDWAQGDWVLLQLDRQVIYPDNKPLNRAWVRSGGLSKLSAVDALAELVDQ